MICPKCGTEQPEAAACRKCGLAAERMASFQEQVPAPPAAVVATWDACRAAWDDPARHEQFVAAVIDGGAFAYAARQYRGVLAERPDDAVATAQLERLGKMAEAALHATATQKPETAPRPYRNATAILVVCIVAMLFGLVYVLVLARDEEDDHQLRPAPARPAVPPRR